MSRLLGGFTPRALVQVLTFRPLRPESLIIKRGGPRRSDLDGGRGPQHNGIGTMSVEENNGEASSSKNQRDNSGTKGSTQVNNNTGNTAAPKET